MCHRLDARFFDRLAGMDHTGVCARTRAVHDKSRGTYHLPALSDEIEVDLRAREIRAVGGEVRPVSVELGLAVLFYLMQSDGTAPRGRWVSEKDLKGGVQFFQGPHAIQTRPVAEACADGLDRVTAAALKLGGTPVAMGDAAFTFPALPLVPLAVVLWRGDDEFPAECKLLMDATIDRHLPLDVIYGLAIEVARRLTGLPLIH